jgi:hypothetical protein
VVTVSLEHFASRMEAASREAELIATCRPRYNQRSEPFSNDVYPIRVFLGGPVHGLADAYAGDLEEDWRRYLWYWTVTLDAPLGLQIADQALRQARYKFLAEAGRTHYYIFDDWGGWGTDDPQFDDDTTLSEWRTQPFILCGGS